VTGDVQEEKPPPSSWHWKVEFASFELKVKVADVWVAYDPLAGPLSIVVSGGEVSAVHVRSAWGPALPARSTARTRKE
jgi:hypothetical protein